MSTKLAIVANTDPAVMSALKNSIYPGANDESIAMVLSYCQAAGLDPLQKPVHIVPMSVKQGKEYVYRDVVMPGIGLYRTQASRSGEHAGTSEPEFGEMVTTRLGSMEFTYPEWCKVTVTKIVQGQLTQYSAKEYWIENYATAGKDKLEPNAMWKKRPRGQIAKCAEAQALRKAFPEIGSQPTAEEMEGKIIDITGAVIQNEVDCKSAEQAQFEEAYLPSLREAALNGALALQTSFASIPAGKAKNDLWREYGSSLKSATTLSEKKSALDK